MDLDALFILLQPWLRPFLAFVFFTFLLYLLNAAYNDAACTPSTPAIAPATAMITFKTTLQVFFIDFSSFLF